MEFSKLSASEKMATYASVAVVILAIYAVAQDWGGLPVISLIGAVAVLAIVFLPQMSPGTNLPGSRGSLMLIAGGAAAIFWAIAALSWLNWIFNHLTAVDTWIFLVGLAAALWLGWMSWQAFQGEGGKFVLGSSGGASAAPPAAPAPSEPPAQMAPPPAPAAPPPAPAAPPASSMPEPPAPSYGSEQDTGTAAEGDGGSDEETTG